MQAARAVAAAWRNRNLPGYKDASEKLAEIGLTTPGSPGWMVDTSLMHVNSMRDTPEWWAVIGGTIGKEADVLSYGIKKIADAIDLPAAAAIAPVSSLPAIRTPTSLVKEEEETPSMLPWKWLAVSALVIGGVAWAGYYFLRRPSPRRAF